MISMAPGRSPAAMMRVTASPAACSVAYDASTVR